MPDKRSRQPTLEPEGNPQYLDLTVEQARALRAEQARLGALCADRYTGARAAGRYGAMLRWAGEYRRCAARCRRLGERLGARRPVHRPRSPCAIRASSHSSPGIPDAAPTGEAA